MPGKIGYTLLDYSREYKSFSVITGDVTAVSLPGLLTQIGNLRTATAAIVLGRIADEELVAFRTNLSDVPPTSDLAQRETAFLVHYADITPFFDDPVNAIPNEGFGRIFTLTIPTADIHLRLRPNSDEVDLANAGIAAWITAFEAVARTPYGGSVNVIRIDHVGRNS